MSTIQFQEQIIYLTDKYKISFDLFVNGVHSFFPVFKSNARRVMLGSPLFEIALIDILISEAKGAKTLASKFLKDTR